MGVVDSLSAGYRFVSRRLELLVLPLLLDALLWLAPRLSVQPLFEQIATFYSEIDAEIGGSAETADLFAQMTDLMRVVGESFNLLNLLISSTLYHFPSLLISVPELKVDHNSVQIQSPLWVVGLTVLLGLLGLLIGVLYMNLLARALPLGEGEKQTSLGRFLAQIVRQWLRTIFFLIGMVVLLAMIYIPTSIGASLLLLLIPPLAGGAFLLMSGVLVVIFFYLYFVTVGLVLDDLPIWQAVVRSAVLVRHTFWTTLAFILVSGVISAGISLLLGRLALSGPVGVFLAAPANAFIGTGLAMALLVFYRTQLIKMVEERTQQANQQKV